jgi:cytochrome c oxidase assembly protein subunit 15
LRAGSSAEYGLDPLAIALQAVLGIFTLLNQVPMDLALVHQAVAIVVLTLAILQAGRLAGRQAEQASQQLVLPVHPSRPS